MGVFLTCAVSLPASSSTDAATSSAQSQTLQFSVYLNDKPIGYHRFVVEKRGDVEIIESVANFKVRFLVFDAYEYQHTNREVWRQGCLYKMESRTDDNGEQFAVTAEPKQQALSVTTRRESDQFEGCVKTFAYWDANLLAADRLLNAQTGEYLDVTVQKMGQGEVQYGDITREATRYRIKGKDLSIDVWYSPQGEWLALDSVKDGKLIKYRREL